MQWGCHFHAMPAGRIGLSSLHTLCYCDRSGCIPALSRLCLGTMIDLCYWMWTRSPRHPSTNKLPYDTPFCGPFHPSARYSPGPFHPGFRPACFVQLVDPVIFHLSSGFYPLDNIEHLFYISFMSASYRLPCNRWVWKPIIRLFSRSQPSVPQTFLGFDCLLICPCLILRNDQTTDL